MYGMGKGGRARGRMAPVVRWVPGEILHKNLSTSLCHNDGVLRGRPEVAEQGERDE
jgi:hypothetical protein